MTAVSAHLRAARERAGLTIEDISASTKIGASALLAIERGDFSKLPGDFYTRAFLRTYARELQLSPDAIVNQFEADRAPAQPSGSPQTGAGTSGLPAESQPAASWEPAVRAIGSQVIAVATSAGVVITVVVVLLFAIVARSRPVASRVPEPGAIGTSGAAAAVPAASAGTSTSEAPADRLVIEIQAAAPIWVTGAADGKRVLYRLLAPGERVRIEARDALAFRVGNAAAFTYAINGVEGKPLGGAGEVRDVQFTRENYRTFRR